MTAALSPQGAAQPSVQLSLQSSLQFSQLPAPPPEQPPAPAAEHAALQALRTRHAHKLDPVRWAYLQALARRAAQQHGELKAHLEARLAQAVAAYTQAFENANAAAQTQCTDLHKRFPQAATALHQHRAEADFVALAHLAAQLQAQAQPQPLAELVRHIQNHSSALDAAGEQPQGPGTASAPGALPGEKVGTPSTAPAEAPQLRALRLYQDTWARLSTDQQLARSLAHVPSNPGPLNSQLLVLRSLRLMQDIAPAYLDHFLSYAKTLMWLERRAAGSAGLPAEAGAARTEAGDRAAKNKPVRGLPAKRARKA